MKAAPAPAPTSTAPAASPPAPAEPNTAAAAAAVAADPVAAVADEPQLERIVLDLPPCAGGGISHAGVMYLSRVAYNVPAATAADLLEIQNRCKAHESSLVESENRGRRRQGAYLRGAA